MKLYIILVSYLVTSCNAQSRLEDFNKLNNKILDEINSIIQSNPDRLNDFCGNTLIIYKSFILALDNINQKEVIENIKNILKSNNRYISSSHPIVSDNIKELIQTLDLVVYSSQIKKFQLDEQFAFVVNDLKTRLNKPEQIDLPEKMLTILFNLLTEEKAALYFNTYVIDTLVSRNIIYSFKRDQKEFSKLAIENIPKMDQNPAQVYLFYSFLNINDNSTKYKSFIETELKRMKSNNNLTQKSINSLQLLESEFILKISK